MTASLRATLAVAALAVTLATLSPGLAASPRPLPSQQEKRDYALIFGTVWDKNDRPVYGVKVNIRRADHKKAQWKLVSDHRGEFAQRVPTGNVEYIIWADQKPKKGSKPAETKVHIENNERVDVSLHLTE